MARFPPPSDELWITMNGKAVMVDTLEPEKWNACKKKMMENVGKTMSAEWLSEPFIPNKRG